jgi:hypothetical protein
VRIRSLRPVIAKRWPFLWEVVKALTIEPRPAESI